MERPSIIQQLRMRTLKSFGHHPWQCKRKDKCCSSPSVPVHSEVDVSRENCESMSELDTTHISGLSQDFTCSDPPSCVESSPTSSFPQVCVTASSGRFRCIQDSHCLPCEQFCRPVRTIQDSPVSRWTRGPGSPVLLVYEESRVTME